jgi:hypothetical protein
VLAIRRAGSGQQYEIKWKGHQETSWEPAARVRKQIPLLVQEFEQRQQQQPQQQQATDHDAPMLQEEGAEGKEAGADESADEVVAADGSSMRAQMEAMQRLLREQAQQLQQLRAWPSQSPQPSPPQQLRSIAVAAAAAAPAPAPARRREPRLSDLAEYNGASGDQLDAWLAELRRCARYYQLSGPEAVEFAAARLRDTADIWWATLDSSAQAAIDSVEALATAMRNRFQPITTARVAREKLYALQQGGRHIDEYIADFSRLHAQVRDMSEPDARAQFVRGLRQELATKLEDVEWESMPLATLIAKAARIGARSAAAARATQGRPAAAINQMDVDDGDGASLDERIQRAVLNAMSAHSSSGMGAKTQTHRGYAQERQQGSGAARGGFAGGRGGRGFGQRGPPVVPGVPEAVVRRRMDAKQCVRCGVEGHISPACPNTISASGN